jgi:hypothetical protein
LVLWALTPHTKRHAPSRCTALVATPFTQTHNTTHATIARLVVVVVVVVRGRRVGVAPPAVVGDLEVEREREEEALGRAERPAVRPPRVRDEAAEDVRACRGGGVARKEGAPSPRGRNRRRRRARRRVEMTVCRTRSASSLHHSQ